MLSRLLLRQSKNPFTSFIVRFNSQDAASSNPCVHLSDKNNDKLKQKNGTSLVKRCPTGLQINCNVVEINIACEIGAPLSSYLKSNPRIDVGISNDFKVNGQLRDGLCNALGGYFTSNTRSSSPSFSLFNKNNPPKRTNSCANITKRNFSTTLQLNFKVAIIGAAGGIGQALSLYMKHHNLVTHLAMYDISKITPGLALDLSHINTCTRVTGHTGEHGLCEALCGANLVVCSAGVPRKPGMSRDDLFKVNADIIIHLSQTLACFSPCAFFAIITNPVNTLVPLAAEILNRMGVFDPRKICGVTTLDVVRAQTFIAQINCCDPAIVEVPVIGGHAGKTIIPILSQSKPKVRVSLQKDIEWLTERIQNAGDEVVNAKAGCGSATLSTAYAASRFMSSLLKGLKIGVFDPRKLCGVTTLDVVRAQTFIGEINCCNPACVDVPVIGGHAGTTIVPVFSQARPKPALVSQCEIEALTKKIQEAGTEVVNAKAGGGSATVSTAYAASRLASSILKGLTGQCCVECAYVHSCVTEAPFFSTPLVLGQCGVEANLGLGCLNHYEQVQVVEAVGILKRNAREAVDYVNAKSKSACEPKKETKNESKLATENPKNPCKK